jgi:hypothetical protein
MPPYPNSMKINYQTQDDEDAPIPKVGLYYVKDTYGWNPWQPTSSRRQIQNVIVFLVAHHHKEDEDKCWKSKGNQGK